MIICPARILLNTFHIFQPAGEQQKLFPSISALGHFGAVDKVVSEKQQ